MSSYLGAYFLVVREVAGTACGLPPAQGTVRLTVELNTDDGGSLLGPNTHQNTVIRDGKAGKIGLCSSYYYEAPED